MYRLYAHLLCAIKIVLSSLIMYVQLGSHCHTLPPCGPPAPPFAFPLPFPSPLTSSVGSSASTFSSRTMHPCLSRVTSRVQPASCRGLCPMLMTVVVWHFSRSLCRTCDWLDASRALVACVCGVYVRVALSQHIAPENTRAHTQTRQPPNQNGDARSHLVKHQDTGSRQHAARHGEALLLPAAQDERPLPDLRLVLLREAHDEAVRVYVCVYIHMYMSKGQRSKPKSDPYPTTTAPCPSTQHARTRGRWRARRPPEFPRPRPRAGRSRCSPGPSRRRAWAPA